MARILNNVGNPGASPVYVVDPLTGTYIQPLSDGSSPASILFANSPAVDAFSRLRASLPVNLFNSTLQYGLAPLEWNEVDTSGGATTWLSNESAALLSVTSTTGSSVVRQTKRYFRYQPGKSQLILCTFNMQGIQAGVTKEIGYGDANNGLFLRISDQAYFVVRTSTSGSVVETTIPQSQWNVDKFDGTGPSGITIDWTKAQILEIDFQWLGTGRVRFGFSINGCTFLAHQVLNANNITLVYMATANLPMRCAITQVSSGVSATMKQICTSVIAEGGVDSVSAYEFGISNGITTVAVTTRRPILSIQRAATFNGLVSRGAFNLQMFGAYAVTNDAYIELVYGGTLTGAAFSAVNSNSQFNKDTSATAITGGITISTLFANTGSGHTSGNVFNASTNLQYSMGLDVSGANAPVLSVVATSFNSTSNVSAQLQWDEYY